MKHKIINRMKLEFDATSQNEAFARMAVSVFAAALDPTLEEISDLRVVVSEAVTNAIVHAYKNRGGKVMIAATLYEDRRLKLKIQDKGCGIAELDRCLEPLYTTDPTGERGGMGFPIMQAMSDKFRVKTAVGVGTTLYIEFRFQS